jgi:hypothetical protein
VKGDIRRGMVRGARIGVLAGLSLAGLYAAIGALATTEFTKSLGHSLLFIGFPTLFAVVPALQWLGLQGGRLEGVVALLLTLSVNGALWGAITGALLAARPRNLLPTTQHSSRRHYG